MISPTVRFLFGDTPRQVGWYRRLVQTPWEFEKFIEDANGKEEVYTNAFPLDGIYQSVVFDFDKKGAYEDAKTVYRWGLRKGFNSLATVSGKKGYHVYLLSTPYRVNHEGLVDIYAQILKDALNITQFDDETSVDFHLVSNPSALIRVPGTLRVPENNAYCSFLPPDWYNLSEAETLQYTKCPQDFKFDLHPKRSLLELLSEPLTASDLILDSPNVELTARGDSHPDYTYIRKLLLHPVSDGRHRLVRFVLAPFFSNVVGLDSQEGCRIIGAWLSACEKLHPTTIRQTLSHDYAYAKAKHYMPRSLSSIKKHDSDLYVIISNATGLSC